jgi:hypothetical protein
MDDVSRGTYDMNETNYKPLLDKFLQDAKTERMRHLSMWATGRWEMVFLMEF